MDKLVYPYNGPLLKNTKEESFYTSNNLDRSQMTYAEWEWKRPMAKILNI